jgi:2-iminobutanoate/2-iminopropanoate deaminase
MRQAIFTEKAPVPGGTYSQAVILNGVAYIAGQGSFLPGTTTFAPGTFREQAERTFQNIGALLEACGSSFAHVAKVSVFLTDLSNFAALNEIYPRYFKAPFPARTTVQAGLSGDMLIEVDCIAEVPGKGEVA